MINNDEELRGTLNRIEKFRNQIMHLREVETNPAVYELSAGGFIAEISRMNLEVSEYLALHPKRFVGEQELVGV
jgi:hypothetical protein